MLVRSEIQNPYSSIDQVPNAYLLQDAAVSCRANILERLDADLDYKPFFRIYPFADPPYAAHEKWDDADMTGRYVEALILARRMTGGTMELREPKLREYLVSLFDPSDGLAYTQQTEWTPRRACMFSQSCAMLGLIAWHDESGSPAVKLLLDKHVEGLMKLSIRKENYAYFPKYEWDGQQWIDEPVGKDAPAWYGGRNLLPLVEYWQRFPRPDVAEFIERLARYCIEVNPTVKPDGSVTGGEGWWGHLHGTQDMVAGIAEYARLAGKREWVDWAKRVYDWVGRTNTSRFGFMADMAGGHICESCGIASRARLGLTLYRAGAIEDPFGEIDRFVRNQLLENQFKDTSFLKPMQPTTTAPAGGQKCYQDIDRMILGQFQCWATANDLIGHDDIEGCGAGGGMQALHLAWSNVAEWKGEELSVHLLFNRRIGAKHSGPVSASNPLALEIWSHLPYEGRVDLVAHRPVKARVRLPDQSAMENVRLLHREGETSLKPEGQYVPLPALAEGERVSIRFGLQTAQTDERAAGKSYRIRWKGSTVLAQEPRGEKVPLYTKRGEFERREAPLCAPRYP